MLLLIIDEETILVHILHQLVIFEGNILEEVCCSSAT